MSCSCFEASVQSRVQPRNSLDDIQSPEGQDRVTMPVFLCFGGINTFLMAPVNGKPNQCSKKIKLRFVLQ